MARYIFNGTFSVGDGTIVSGGTISVYLAGTTTAASVYTASSGGTAVNSVTSGSDGHFYFYVDDSDYATTQKFKITLSKTGFTDKDYDNLVIFPVIAHTHASAGDGGNTLDTPTIADFTNATHDHSNAANGGNTLDTPTIADFTNATHDHSNAANGGNTLTTPTIASFVNATHDHSNAAGGGSTLNSPTLVTPTIASFTNATHDHADAAGGGKFTNVVQKVHSQIATQAATTNTIPWDTSIPQITEGQLWLYVSITPTNASNKLYIEAVAHVSLSVAGAVIGAIFQDSTANAIATGAVDMTAADVMEPIVIRHEMTAGTTSSTTFKLNIGGESGTTTVNGVAAAGKLGDTLVTSLTVTEIRV